MSKLAAFILEKRYWLLALSALFAAINIYLMGLVTINTDMTVYLPDDSSVRAGLGVLQDQFDDVGGNLHVMFENLEAPVADRFLAIDGVETVSSRSEGEFTLYSLDLFDTDGVVEAIEAEFAGYGIAMSGALEGVDPVPDNMMLFIAVPTVIILTLILFSMCASWFEPVIFFINIGIAILINLGTNVIFEHVSDVTMMIAALLQVVLSMDYSIIFLNRYRLEKERASGDAKLAMRRTLENSFSVVSGIAFTTIVGMLMLVFMSFRIGADIGFVIAKGVFVSLVCVFSVMPALILKFDGLIEKTAKPVLRLNMSKVGSFAYNVRYGMLAAFLVLFGFAFYLQGNIHITYSDTGADPVHHVFDLENSFVVLYENADESAMSHVLESLESHDFVLEVSAYGNTLGRALTEAELAEVLELDPTFSALIIRNYYEAALPELTLAEFLSFLQTDVPQNPLFAGFLNAEMLGQLDMLPLMVDPAMMDASMTNTELAELLQLEPAVVAQLLYLYDFLHGEDLEMTMTLSNFMAYLINDFSQHPLFGPAFYPEILEQLETGLSEMEDARHQLVGPEFSRAIIQTDLPFESPETFAFIDDLLETLNNELAGRSYVLGASAMPHEMAQSFPSEHSFITILTAIAFFFVSALSFKSMPVAIILVFVIQAAVYITMGTIAFQEGGIMYLPLIIAQVLLKSRVIDYGILYTANYIEARKNFGAKEAITQALNASMPTILTSGLIIVLITFVTGLIFLDINASIAEIMLLIAQGCLIGTLISVFVLPSLIAVFDKWVTRAKAKAH